MSSAFLYLAIVAIWAFVLIPRWLRRPQASARSGADVAVNDSGEQADDADGHGRRRRTGSLPGPPDIQRSPALPSRSRTLRARRRLLTMLILLTAAAAACVDLKLAPWWAGVPPTGMLGVYLLLLRECSLADAELARQRAAMDARIRAARKRAQVARAQPARAPAAHRSAQIIDISARIEDQLYDQYADATARAVGD